MKIIITSIITLLLSLTAIAQDRKVAVFDPAGSVEGPIKEIVREEISSIIVNSGGYTVLERQLIDKVLEENKFQSGGLVDDSQISEIGRRMGANLVFVSSITALGGSNYYISCKMIDVQTARIEKQRTGQTQRGSNDLINVVQKMVKDMFTNVSNTSEVFQQTKPIIEKNPIPVSDFLVADGCDIFRNGKKLNKIEVQSILANTDALRLYDKGISKYRKGRNCTTIGLCSILGGVALCVTGNEISDDYVLVAGGLLTTAGLVLEITGIIIKINAKSYIKKSISAYNNEKNTSIMELKMGFTGNGVGLALCF